MDDYAIKKGFSTDENLHFDDLFIKDFNEQNEKYKEILKKIKENNEE